MDIEVTVLSESAAAKSAVAMIPEIKRQADRPTTQRAANRALKLVLKSRKPGMSVIVKPTGVPLQTALTRVQSAGITFDEAGRAVPAELPKKSDLNTHRGTGYVVLSADPSIVKGLLRKTLKQVDEIRGTGLIAALGVDVGGKRPAGLLLSVDDAGQMYPFAFVGTPLAANKVMQRLSGNDAVANLERTTLQPEGESNPAKPEPVAPKADAAPKSGVVNLDDLEGTAPRYGEPGQPVRKGSKVRRKAAPVAEQEPSPVEEPAPAQAPAAPPTPSTAPAAPAQKPDTVGNSFINEITAAGLTKAKLVKALKARAEVPLAAGQNPVLMDLSTAIGDSSTVANAWAKLTAKDFQDAIDPSLLYQFEDTRGLNSMLVTLDSLDGDSGYVRGYMFWLSLYSSYSDVSDYASGLNQISPDLVSDEVLDQAQSYGMLTGAEIKQVEKAARAKVKGVSDAPKPSAQEAKSDLNMQYLPSASVESVAEAVNALGASVGFQATVKGKTMELTAVGELASDLTFDKPPAHTFEVTGGQRWTLRNAGTVVAEYNSMTATDLLRAYVTYSGVPFQQVATQYPEVFRFVSSTQAPKQQAMEAAILASSTNEHLIKTFNDCFKRFGFSAKMNRSEQAPQIVSTGETAAGFMEGINVFVANTGEGNWFLYSMGKDDRDGNTVEGDEFPSVTARQILEFYGKFQRKQKGQASIDAAIAGQTT